MAAINKIRKLRIMVRRRYPSTLSQIPKVISILELILGINMQESSL
jgi:hypothetical protein